MTHKVGGEYHKQDYSIEVKATRWEVAAMIAVLSVLSVIFILAVTG